MEFQHFLDAQAGIYDQVLRGLAAGEKYSHWMWFIFPQIKGLGHSTTSQRFALDSLDAATRYLNHPVLGPRLLECTQLVLQVQNRTAEDIFDTIDALKFRSSMTLFALCSPPNSVFHQALEKYYSGHPDSKTLRLAGVEGSP